MADSEDLPAVIPQVVFDKHGEPIIAREIVVEPSPVPKVLTIFILIMVVSSVVYGFIQERQDEAETAERRAENTELLNRLQDQSDRIQAQVDIGRMERDRLRALMVALASRASADPEVQRLLTEFATESDTPPRSSQPGAITPRPGQTAAPEGPPERQTTPAPEPSRRPSPAPRPSPTSAPASPRPTASASPTPVSALPLLPCLTTITIAGRCI